ncbi:MAG: hypothetical protein A2589_01630 [Candidatus Vogelbacteria bacterium RIFOXYD1_FULL_46_19]|uniref:Type II secretion system protein GspF domain-containing protein n=1 Tax=Candidatus Vogelbacteria bacterium RIFOXYD1_FULL_46_19 TaxID=1802439 RepID=A0A1G2QG01_9BACT|nr:MAG: hypothetical protein A2589_01630 [Candidatus Vogelbacteria bacterium RIFOXYD1_FULL_46_19]
MNIFNYIKTGEKVEFANSLAVMLKSGMAVNEALFTLSEQTSSRAFKRVIVGIAEKIQAGTSLSKAFEAEREVFGGVFISMIKVAESSGTLDESLAYLAEWLERDHTLKQEIKAATFYPRFVFGATILMGAGLSLYILPKLIPLFSQLRVELPLATRLLLGFTHFIQNYWYLAILGLIGFYIAFKMLNKLRLVRKILHTGYIKVPIVGSLIATYQLALVTRLFETLLKSGLSLRETIEVTSGAVTNVNYEDSLLVVGSRVVGGTPLSVALADWPKLYPKNLVSIIATGEKSGTIDESLGYLADHYIKIVQSKTKQLPTILEPALLIFIGVAVGFVALAIIMPIYDLTSGVF